MKYKGYTGQVSFDSEARLFHGEVTGLKDVITFQGKDVDGLLKAFKESINDYLEWCKERGEKPEKTFSGHLRLRMNKDLHKKLAQQALLQGLSLNSLIVNKLSK